MEADPEGRATGSADAATQPGATKAARPEGQRGASASASASASAKKTASRSEDALSRFHEEVRLGEAYDARMLLKLWPFVRPHAKQLGLSLLLLVVTAVLAVLRPLVMRDAVDGSGSPDGLARLTRAGFLLTGIMLVELSLSFPQLYSMQLAGARSMADLRARVFGFLHTRRLDAGRPAGHAGNERR
jgi:ATP-binding cassette, subfamily B, multidrug efflux pump